jgi:small subunit ribosomal protein S10
MKKESIKITLESFDHLVLNKAMNEIIVTVRRTGAAIKGPIPLPTKIEKFCVIRGPHVDKDSREQFEIRSSKRLLIISPTAQTVDALMKLSLSAGVNIKIAINGTGGLKN